MTTAPSTARIYTAPAARQTETAPAPPPYGVQAAAQIPGPWDLGNIDELTLAKLRLLALRAPPGQRLEAVRRRPWPFIGAAAVVGLLLGRSGLARGIVGKGLAWGLRRAVTSNLHRLRR